MPREFYPADRNINMCGIAGVKGPGDLSLPITQMVKAMNRRGPDDAGIWYSQDRALALGHARLSIIDLTSAGHQPMIGASGRYSIVFNGEIFNYNDLKKELIGLGHTFQTSSDTEVLLVGWYAWGTDLVKKLRGMFAFAIWDEQEKEIYLVRDRMGVKPLLFAEKNGYLVFGSTLDAILASGLVDRKLSKAGLCDLMSLGSVIQPRTLIEGVKSLEPGTILCIRNNGSSELTTYWKLQKNPSLGAELFLLSYDEQVKRLQDILEDACRYHMIADVKIGSFLSGGVDSSAITALMARLSTKPIATFSIGFENRNNLENELTEAAEAARYLGCDHHELMLNGQMVEQNFDDFVSVIDQPSYDGINTYWVSKMSGSSVKVALSGLGGDELFAGYGHFAWSSIYSSQTSSFKFIQNLYRSNPFRWARLYNQYMKVAGGHGRLATLRRLNYNSGLEAKMNSEFVHPLEREDWVIQAMKKQGFPDSTDMENITRYECRNYLLNTLLRDADALSMGHGLEVRPVLLDNELVEFALALPDSAKIRDGRNKAILKDACKDYLPSGYFERKKKGFTLPTVSWLQNEMKARLASNLNSSEAKQLFSNQYLYSDLPRQVSQGNGLSAWMTLVLLEWIRSKNIDLD